MSINFILVRILRLPTHRLIFLSFFGFVFFFRFCMPRRTGSSINMRHKAVNFVLLWFDQFDICCIRLIVAVHFNCSSTFVGLVLSRHKSLTTYQKLNSMRFVVRSLVTPTFHIVHFQITFLSSHFQTSIFYVIL